MVSGDRAGNLTRAVLRLGLPAVLKTTRLGYDGKGQAMLRTPDDLDAAWQQLHPKPLILEGFVDFAREISVIVARGADGTASSVRRGSRTAIDVISLDVTLAPARISDAVAAAAQSIAGKVCKRLT